MRDPGWLLFYAGDEFLAELKGNELNFIGMDVYDARWLKEAFNDTRSRMLRELEATGLPGTLSTEVYADLTHRIAVQFTKRIGSLVRASGHGGTLAFVPEGPVGQQTLKRHIDCKYEVGTEPNGPRFRHLLKSMVKRVGELAPPGTNLENAWDLFHSRRDSVLDECEEAFFEHARFYADMMQVDGVLVLDSRLSLLGFGGEIRVDLNLIKVLQALDLDGTRCREWDPRGDGTRHKSVYRLCAVEPSVVALVISQDSQLRITANRHGNVVFWNHTVA